MSRLLLGCWSRRSDLAATSLPRAEQSAGGKNVIPKYVWNRCSEWEWAQYWPVRLRRGARGSAGTRAVQGRAALGAVLVFPELLDTKVSLLTAYVFAGLELRAYRDDCRSPVPRGWEAYLRVPRVLQDGFEGDKWPGRCRS